MYNLRLYIYNIICIIHGNRLDIYNFHIENYVIFIYDYYVSIRLLQKLSAFKAMPLFSQPWKYSIFTDIHRFILKYIMIKMKNILHFLIDLSLIYHLKKKNHNCIIYWGVRAHQSDPIKRGFWLGHQPFLIKNIKIWYLLKDLLMFHPL